MGVLRFSGLKLAEILLMTFAHAEGFLEDNVGERFISGKVIHSAFLAMASIA